MNGIMLGWVLEIVLFGCVLGIGLLTGQWAGLPLMLVALSIMAVSTARRRDERLE